MVAQEVIQRIAANNPLANKEILEERLRLSSAAPEMREFCLALWQVAQSPATDHVLRDACLEAIDDAQVGGHKGGQGFFARIAAAACFLVFATIATLGIIEMRRRASSTEQAVLGVNASVNAIQSRLIDISTMAKTPLATIPTDLLQAFRSDIQRIEDTQRKEVAQIKGTLQEIIARLPRSDSMQVRK